MVETLFYVFGDDVFEVFQVDEVACFGVTSPVTSLQFVIVYRDSWGCCTGTENLAVFLLAPVGVVQAVRRVEMRFRKAEILICFK